MHFFALNEETYFSQPEYFDAKSNNKQGKNFRCHSWFRRQKIWEYSFFVRACGRIIFRYKKKCGRRETCVGDKDIFLEKRIPLTLLSAGSWPRTTDAQRGNSLQCSARLKFNHNPKFLGMAKAYFVCHTGPNFQISLIYAFIVCP